MSMQEEVERAETAGKAAEGVSRRRFLQGAAVIGASVVAMRGEAAGQVVGFNSAAAEASTPNPIVPNFSGQYGKTSVPNLQAPKRPMGSTGLQVSILDRKSTRLNSSHANISY